MRKLLIMLAVSFAVEATAQTECFEDGRLFIGGHGPAQLTIQKRSEDYQDAFTQVFPTDYENRTEWGFHGGFLVGYNLSEKMAILLPISFDRSTYIYETTETYTLRTSGESGLVRFKENINSISFSVITRFKPFPGCNGLTFSIGPNFTKGLNGKGSGVFDNGAKTQPLFDTQDIKFGDDRFSDYRGFNAGLVIGIGGTFKIKENTRLTLDI
ncbi:MAG: PorT family protein, partial [Saprospiraceae bacterium]|nr:PorT family protein [Saprospiraceae bacterium]